MPLMRKIPITPNFLTGDVLEAFHRKYLDGSDLASWSEDLLTAGFSSDAIIEALSDPEMHWQTVPIIFSKICFDIGLSTNVAKEICSLKRATMLEEYRHGHRQALEMLHRFDELRIDTGFPESIEFRLLEDNSDCTNASGYYGSQSKRFGEELENLARTYLGRAKI